MFPKEVSNSSDQDQDQCSVGSDMGPNCLPRLSTDEKVVTSKQRAILVWVFDLIDIKRQVLAYLHNSLYLNIRIYPSCLNLSENHFLSGYITFYFTF